jgi:uncharacterized membrane protein
MTAAKPYRYLNVQFRLLLSAGAALVIAALLPGWVHLPTLLLCAWDAGMFCFLFLSWWVMLRATPDSMRRYAQKQDISRVIILTLITAAACVSVLAIAFLLRDSKHPTYPLFWLHLGLAFSTIVGAWLLVHTIFAAHYARGYYRDNNKSLSQLREEGLDFPGDLEPDYWDFLYFSFVIGMTSQVSDVQVLSRSLRKLALLHGILSFFFNTMILAMSINIIAGLIQSSSG